MVGTTTQYVVPVLMRRPRSDYTSPPERIAHRTSAARRGWFAGWPDHCPTLAARQSAEVVRQQDGRVFRFSVDKRLTQLFAEWLTYSQELGYPLIGAREVNANGKKQGGTGSFSCRAIKGSNPPQPSNHSTGTAVDVYTRSNPQRWGDALRFWSTIHPYMIELAAAADIYWGGWYWDTSQGTYMDAMHFEYMGRPEDVAESLARLRSTYEAIRAQPVP